MDERDELVEKLRTLARKLGKSAVSRREFLSQSGESSRKILSLFGSYNELVEAAGLEPQRFLSTGDPQYSDEGLLQEVVRVLRLPGARLTTIYFDKCARISVSACQRRFGSWINTLTAALKRLDPQADAELIRRVREYTNPPVSRSPTTDAEGTQGHGEEAANDAGGAASLHDKWLLQASRDRFTAISSTSAACSTLRQTNRESSSYSVWCAKSWTMWLRSLNRVSPIARQNGEFSARKACGNVCG